MEQARLALVEALCMIRLRQPEPRVVDVVTNLVEQGAQIRAELDEGVALPVDGLLRAREPSVVGERRHYWPVKRGFLFSRNAFAPSMRSSVVLRSVARSFSRRRPSSSGRPSPFTTASFA